MTHTASIWTCSGELPFPTPEVIFIDFSSLTGLQPMSKTSEPIEVGSVTVSEESCFEAKKTSTWSKFTQLFDNKPEVNTSPNPIFGAILVFINIPHSVCVGCDSLAGVLSRRH